MKTALILSIIISYYQLSVGAKCASHIPPQIAPLLDCVPKLNGTCLGEEVKCLRNNILNQPDLSNLRGNWDSSISFFNPYLARVNATYQNSSRTPCPWKYEAQYDANRYPRYIHNVVCHSPNDCYDNTGHMIASCSCQEVKYTMPIMRRTKCDSNGQQWQSDYATVNVACIPRFN